MQKTYIAWIVAAVVIVGGIYLFTRPNATPASTPSQATTSQNPSTTEGTQAPMTTTVIYGPNGFSPSTVTIAKGGTVTFINQGGDEMWVASNPHPTHEGYDGTTKDVHCVSGYSGLAPFDQCSVGTTYTFTFNKTGTWGYHNHGNHSDIGTVIVQ